MGKVMSEEKAPSGNKKTMVILVAGLLVVVLALAGAVAYLFLGKKKKVMGEPLQRKPLNCRSSKKLIRLW